MLLIAIEGIDKAGKDTQTKRLGIRLKRRGYKVKRIAFPDYKTSLGKEIQRFLQGKIDLRPEVRQLLFVANRWERQRNIEEWLKRELFVIADRYIPSGLAYGLANGLDLSWMMKLEEGLPAANLVIVIDISIETSFSRAERKDMYEKDKMFLSKVRSSYLKLAGSYGWIVVDGEMNADDVSQEIWKNIRSRVDIQ